MYFLQTLFSDLPRGPRGSISYELFSDLPRGPRGSVSCELFYDLPRSKIPTWVKISYFGKNILLW